MRQGVSTNNSGFDAPLNLCEIGTGGGQQAAEVDHARDVDACDALLDLTSNPGAGGVHQGVLLLDVLTMACLVGVLVERRVIKVFHGERPFSDGISSG